MKKSQMIFNLVLTLIVIGLMATVYFVAVRQDDEEPQEEAPSTVVSLINRAEADVAQIVFYSDGERSVLMPHTTEFGGIRWTYSTVKDCALNPFSVLNKARPAWLLSAADVAHADSSYVELAEFGLLPPEFIVEVDFLDGSRHVLRFGSHTANMLHRFLMIDDDPAIYLVNSEVVESLQTPAGALLDLSMPAIHLEDVEYIRVAARGGVPLVFGLPEEGEEPPLFGFVDAGGGEHLVMLEPLANTAISHSRLMEFLVMPASHVRFISVAEIHVTDFARFGLDEPSLELILRTPDDEAHLLFGDTFQRGEFELIYVKSTASPHVFIAEAANARDLKALEPFDIAERAFALVSIDTVERLTLEFPDYSFEIIFNHIFETFEIEPTVNGHEADDRETRRVFADVLRLQADAEIETFTPTAPPEITVTHHRFHEADIVLRFFDYNATFLAATVDGGEAGFVINRRALDRLLESAKALTPYHHAGDLRCACGEFFLGEDLRTPSPPLNFREWNELPDDFLENFENIREWSFLERGDLSNPHFYVAEYAEIRPHAIVLWPDENLRDFRVLALDFTEEGYDMTFFTREVLLTLDKLSYGDALVFNVSMLHYLVSRMGIVFTDESGATRRFFLRTSMRGGCAPLYFIAEHDENYWGWVD